jgi:hypothetical protein
MHMLENAEDKERFIAHDRGELVYNTDIVI